MAQNFGFMGGYQPAQLQQFDQSYVNTNINEQMQKAHKELDQMKKLIDRRDSLVKKQIQVDQMEWNIRQQQGSFESYIDSQQNSFLNVLHSRGMKLWQKNSIFFLQINYGGEIFRGDHAAIGKIISSNFGRKIVIIDDLQEVDRSSPSTVYILSYSIQIIQDERFRPDIYQEFYLDNNVVYRNLFVPNLHLQKRSAYPIPAHESVTMHFLKSMVNNDQDKFDHIMKLLAYFYKRLRKQGTALALLGDKRVTEKIFMDIIIKKIFDAKYYITINDSTLEDKSMVEIVANMLIYHIGEVSDEKAKSEDFRNLLQYVLVENTIESDNLSNGGKTTDIYGQTIVTSNTPDAIIENCNSKCTFIEVNDLEDILKDLKLQDFMDISQKISDDLDNFTNILAIYSVDDDFFNTTIQMQTKTEDEKIQDFIHSIKSDTKSLLKKIKHKNGDLHKEMEDDIMINNGIKQSKLFDYFTALYNKVVSFSDNGQFLKILREKDDFFKQAPKQILSHKYYIMIN